MSIEDLEKKKEKKKTSIGEICINHTKKNLAIFVGYYASNKKGSKKTNKQKR